MKIEKRYTINYIVHAISVLDIELFTQILKPLADSVQQKCELGQYVHDFERIFRELDFEDTYFNVAHSLCANKGCNAYRYTFISNHSQRNFTLLFLVQNNGFIELNECNQLTHANQIRFSSIKGHAIEVPF
jgi:hypothetical protein